MEYDMRCWRMDGSLHTAVSFAPFYPQLRTRASGQTSLQSNHKTNALVRNRRRRRGDGWCCITSHHPDSCGAYLWVGSDELLEHEGVVDTVSDTGGVSHNFVTLTLLHEAVDNFLRAVGSLVDC